MHYSSNKMADVVPVGQSKQKKREKEREREDNNKRNEYIKIIKTSKEENDTRCNHDEMNPKWLS